MIVFSSFHYLNLWGIHVCIIWSFHPTRKYDKSTQKHWWFEFQGLVPLLLTIWLKWLSLIEVKSHTNMCVDNRTLPMLCCLPHLTHKLTL